MFEIPVWVNWVSLPVLALALTLLDYWVAKWLQPTHIRIRSSPYSEDATIGSIFALLMILSFMGIFFGFIAAVTDVSLVRAIIVELAFLAFFLWALIPKTMWLVAALCYEMAFLVGETSVNQDARYDGLTLLAISTVLLVIALTIGPLRTIKTTKSRATDGSV